MKILFITDNFPPEVNAPASRTYDHCRRWVEAGVEVTVITCAPNFPKGRVFEGYRNRLYQSEVIDGITVLRVWSYMAANEGFLKRILDYLSFSFMAFWVGLFRKCDVIVATSPQFFTTFAGFGLSLFKRKPWVFELRDLWPESVSAVGVMSNSSVIKLFTRIEIFMYRHASLIIPVTDAFKDTLVARGIPADKIFVVTNGVDSEVFSPRSKDPELVRELSLEGKFVVAYIGTHGMAHGLDSLATGMKEIKSTDIHFLFIGDGAHKSVLVQKARDLNLNNVTFLDPVSKSEVVRYWSVADAALVPLRKSDVFLTVIPSKIFEAAAMEKPVLLGVQGQAQEIVDKFHAGVFFEPENTSDFQAAVVQMQQDALAYKELKKGCAELAKTYNRDALAESMLNQLRVMIST